MMAGNILGSGAYLGSYYLLPARLIEFVIGMYCATAIAKGGVKRRTMACLAGAGLIAGLVVSTANLHAWAPTAWAIGFGGIVLLVPTHYGPATDRVGDGLGRISFSFYLYHQPVILLAGATIGGLASLIALGAAAAGALCTTVIVACVAFRYLEVPAQRLAKKLTVGGPRGATTSEAPPAPT